MTLSSILLLRSLDGDVIINSMLPSPTASATSGSLGGFTWKMNHELTRVLFRF